MRSSRTSARAADRSARPCRHTPAWRTPILAEPLEGRRLLAIHTWTGAGANDNWSTPANWTGGAPVVNESDVIVVFNTTDANVVQNVAGLTIHHLRFDAGSNIVLQLSQPLTLDAGNPLTPEILNMSGNNQITGTTGLSLTGSVGGSAAFNVVAGTLDLAVSISGSQGLFKDGAGTLRLSGGISNTYPGSTTVRNGTLLLAKTAGDAIPAGGLSVVPIAAGTPTVRLEASNQINDTVNVYLNGDVLLDLNGFDEKVVGLSLRAGSADVTQVMTGSGTLTLASGGLFLDPTGAGGSVTVNGKYNLSLQCPFNIGDSPATPDLIISAILTGDGAFTKTGDGSLRLAGRADNTYGGITEVNAGVLLLAKNPLVGTSNAIPGLLKIGDGISSPGGDVVRLEASDQIDNLATIFIEDFATLDLDRFDEAVGDLGGDQGTVELGTLAAPSHLTFGAGNHFEFFNGDIVNAGIVTKTGVETMTLSHALNNDALVLEATGGGKLMLNNTQHIGLLKISGGSIVSLNPASTPGQRVLVTRALSILDTAKLDLANNALVVNYTGGPTAAPQVRQLLTTGFAGGAGSGPGIKSTTATFSAGNSVGYAENNAALGGLGLTTFLGVTVPATSVLVRYTFAGDANLNGSVGAEDFNLFATHFGQTNQTWFNGDFDYDNTVGAGDFNLLATQFGKSFPAPLVGTPAPTTSTTTSTAPKGSTPAPARPPSRPPLTSLTPRHTIIRSANMIGSNATQ